MARVLGAAHEVHLDEHGSGRHGGARKDRCRYRIGHQVGVAVFLERPRELDNAGPRPGDRQRRVDRLLACGVHPGARPLRRNKLQEIDGIQLDQLLRMQPELLRSLMSRFRPFPFI